MKLFRILFIFTICLTLAASMSYAQWTYFTHINTQPATPLTIIPLSLSVCSAGNIFYGTFNTTGAATSVSMWRISDPLGPSPVFTPFDTFTNVLNGRGFLYGSIHKQSHTLFTVVDAGAIVADSRIRKYNLINLSLDTTWGGGDGHISGTDPAAGNQRVTTAEVTPTGEIIVGRIGFPELPFTIINAAGTANLGNVTTATLPGFHPRSFAFNPLTNDIFASQNSRIFRWRGGTPLNPAGYSVTDMTGEAPFVASRGGITIDFSTDSANPAIYHSVATATPGQFYMCRLANNLNFVSTIDQIGTTAEGSGLDGEISMASDIEIARIGGTLYAIAVDSRVGVYNRIVFYTGNTHVPVDLSGFETY